MNGTPVAVDNDFYAALGERWYAAKDDPVALLRAEGGLKNPWVAATLGRAFAGRACRVLDVGCGGGFLTGLLSREGHAVQGLDYHAEVLRVAKAHDVTRRTGFASGDAYRLPYRDGSFDSVCAMDFLEHVDRPAEVVREVSRVLRPGGLFFFHTFNRNPLAWLVIIKGVEWFVRNTPRHMHLLSLFIKPSELSEYCARYGMGVAEMKGIRPVLDRSFFSMLARRVVPEGFRFRFTGSLALSYIGYAVKRQAPARPAGK